MTVLDEVQTIYRPIEEIDQYLLLLKDLAGRVLEGIESHAGLKKRLGHLLLQRYPSDLQLPHAYLVLLAHLLKFEPLPIQSQQFPNGAACLDVGGLMKGAELPEATQLAELGSLWMILGIHLKNEALLYAGIKVALWQIHTLDHRGFSHVSLWNRAALFQPSKLAASNHLLFTLAYRITSDHGFHQAAQLQKNNGWKEIPLFTQLLMLIPEKITPPLRLSYKPFAEEMTVGLMKFATQHFSFACSLSGWNSGFFSYHKNRVAIVNAGPQMMPFDDLEKFGIERACNVRHFNEMTWEKSAYHFRMKGWSKIFDHPSWMQIEAHYEAQKLRLSCLLQENRPHDDLALVFYARCEELEIRGKEVLKAGSLEKYHGKSLPLELRTESEKIFIEPLSDHEMSILPLAGGDHFWGADFLIAFSYENGKEYFQSLIG